MTIRFQADVNLNQIILRAARRREPALDFQTAETAGLAGLPDPEVLTRAAEDGRILVTHDLRTMPPWGAPRIVGELRKLGIDVAKSTVEKYRVRPQKPPSPTWKTFLKNHVQDLVALDFFVVPTVTHTVLFVLLILAHDRRRVVHFNVTEHPIAQWTAQQIVDAFPWDEAPRYLLRDRDRIYGTSFRRRVRTMGIEEALIAPRSPWQNPYVERLIGSIRRECLITPEQSFQEPHLYLGPIR
jgi:putative transposase